MHKKKETLLHFVGIGGIGMSGIAEVFLNQGYQVTGSDLTHTETTRRLAQLGARIFIGQKAENVTHSHVVVVSSAIRESNSEVQEAKRLRIPIIPRAEMLGELMRGKQGIAVAGSHGKTTTTSMIATVLTWAGLDPTLVIGGKVDSLGGNAKLGQGRFVVAEADESDGSFLHLPATYGVITNIDNDHLDHFGNLGAIEEAFVNFVGKIPFYGLVALCGEDSGVKRCMHRWSKPFVTYGFSEECNLYATDIRCEGFGSHFGVWLREEVGSESRFLGSISLAIPGRHNVLNALAAISISLQLAIPFEKIAEGLSHFRGVKRRFDIRWQDPIRKRAIIDDYGHHPTEIVATLSAARDFWPGRIITVFQPHRFTRTVHCHDGFLSAFSQSDLVFVSDIYSAGEEPIAGVDASSLATDIKKVNPSQREVFYSGDLESTREVVFDFFKDGDLLLCLGAGSITKLPDQWIEKLNSTEV